MTQSIAFLYDSPFIHSVTILTKPSMIISVSDGWNHIMNTIPEAPWIAFVAYDVAFLPGQLALFTRRFWSDSGRDVPPGSNPTPKRLMAFVNWVNMNNFGLYNFFAMDASLIDEVGDFDENLFPAFCEDVDWNIRLSLVPDIITSIFNEVSFWHGEGEYDQNTRYRKSITSYVSGTIYLQNTIPNFEAMRMEGWSW
eukprot:CAMPEP_0182425314 /NCGR_PEP_ID=MMETSP1167-20130531/11700_1 /TAXON_ID=2988 /ORGANISM="Mallomonas Sp, Strain CCMP3275" /LENGTH=195 /DNA_ID=CAMNT_0024605885 /DNA_START=176 /DNA_END=760 /DNA_ORIENTATION=+